MTAKIEQNRLKSAGKKLGTTPNISMASPNIVKITLKKPLAPVFSAMSQFHRRNVDMSSIMRANKVCAISASLCWISLLGSYADDSKPGARSFSRPPAKNQYSYPVEGANGEKIICSAEQIAGQRRMPLSDRAATHGEMMSPGLSALSRLPLGVSQMQTIAAYPFFSACMGMSGIIAVDNGRPEIIMGHSRSMYDMNDYWCAFTFDALSGDYQAIFVSPLYAANILCLGVGNVTGDSQREIVVCLTDGKIFIYSLKTKNLLSSFQALASPVAFAIADLDGDGTDEIILSKAARIQVYRDGVLQWSLSGPGGSLAVGQMDDDASLEIATDNGKVVNVASRTVQWNYSSGFGSLMKCADIDKDGKDEIVAASGKQVSAYDVDTKTVKWTITSANKNVDAICLADVDNDSVYDIIIGDEEYGYISARDTIATETVKWSIQNPKYGVTDIAV
ncbi:MAG: hypothetical protein NTX50_27675, partial [Candidatus Sumerlaeota bacterium]|nr:hypothetical protein [Candidatus Sumerlaeota bacterium]